MTRVEIKTIGGVTEIRMTGHAGYSPGPDVVCSACSILGYTLIGCLIDAQRRGEIERLMHAEQTASLWARFVTKREARPRINTMLDTILTGLKLLEQEYSGYVTVKDLRE